MKKIALLPLLFLCFLAVSAQKPKPAKTVKPAAGLILKNGDILVYEVNNGGQTWHFEVTIKEIREAIVFDWMMPEKDFSGEISLEQSAREQATAYINYFSNGSEQTLTDSSTVWLSRKNYRELKKGSTILSLDKTGAERFDKKENGKIGIILKGKGANLNMFRATNGKQEGEQRELWILDQLSQPLIVKMNLGWTIELKEIKTVQ